MTIIFNKFFIFPFLFVDNSTRHLLNKAVPVMIGRIKRGRIADRCTKSGWKGIPNLRYGGQIDDNSLFIPRESCRFLAHGGRNDKVKVYLICMKRVQKVDERGQNVPQKTR